MRARAAVAAFALLVATAATACGDDSSDGGARPGVGAEPKAGTWKPYVLSSSSAIKVPAPPKGDEADKEQEEVARLARERTPQIEETIKRWSQDVAFRPWLDINMELVSVSVKDPPLASRGYALTTIAIYDALVAAWHWKYEYNRKPPAGVSTATPVSPDPSYPSEHAAAAGAASKVLEYLFPETPVGTFDDMAKQAAESRVQAGVNFRSDVEVGLKLGRSVAEKVLERAKADGADRQWDGTRPPGIGRGPEFWEDPPGLITPPTQPLAGTWKPWALSSANQFRPRPPSKYGSPELMAQTREVMDVTAKLTPEQKGIAEFWAGGAGSALPPGLWNQVALVYVSAAKFTMPRAARMFAALNVALNDSALATWDAKFAYWSPRPINVIRDSGVDPNWRPFLPTPIFPSYTSGHAGYSGAAAAVLSYFFPADAATFDAKAEEAAMSRLYGGIHFREDNDVGAELGRKIGQVVVEKLKQDGAGL